MRNKFALAIMTLLLPIAIWGDPRRAVQANAEIQKPTNNGGDGSTPYPGFTGDPYTRDPRQLITQEYFGNEWVNYLPEDSSVPSPYAHHGYIAGSTAQLTPYSGPKGTYDYFSTLAKSSPRVKMWNIGKSHAGLDMYIVAVASADTIKRLDQYQQNLQKLADPRKLGYPAKQMDADAAAENLIVDAAKLKPIFWIFGKVHSSETGGGEMLMELAYRLVVDKRPIFDEIRNNLIVFITDPNPDGTDMVANWVNHYAKDPVWKSREPSTSGPTAAMPFYNWYTQHDDNRDTFVNSQPEWENLIKANNEWPVQVQLQLHEQDFINWTSANLAAPPQTDPIAQTELQWLAARELNQMAAFGMPGGQTTYPPTCMSYPFTGDMMGLLKNGVGKHYETWHADIWRPYAVQVVGPPQDKGAYWSFQSPLPYPYPKLAWSFRDNINYSQTAALTTAVEMARNRETMLRNYWIKAKNLISAPGVTHMGCNGKFTYPYAYVVPAGQKDSPDTINMINHLLENGVEVHTAGSAFKASGVTALSLPPEDEAPNNGIKAYPAGSFIISMSQPSSLLIYSIFEPHIYPNDAPPRGDSGWQYGLMRDVAVDRVDDAGVGDVPMTLITAKQLAYPYTVSNEIATGYYLINHNTINNVVTFAFDLAKDGYNCSIAEESGDIVHPGDLLVPAGQKNAYEAVKGLTVKLGLTMHSMPAATVRMHEFRLPKVALYHSWDSNLSIQEAGWSRFTFEQFKVPYTIIQRTDVLAGNLRNKYGVIFLPDADASALKTGGTASAEKVPDEVWYGPVQTTHRNGGLGEAGIAELKKFVDSGGVLICNNASSELPISYGFIKDVAILKARDPAGSFDAPGPLVRILPKSANPICYGADEEECLLQDQSPAFSAPPEWTAASYPTDPRKILLSGFLQGADKLAGKAAIVVAKAKDGTGHVVLFGTDITYRWQVHGAYFYLWNIILNWDALP